MTSRVRRDRRRRRAAVGLHLCRQAKDHTGRRTGQPGAGRGRAAARRRRRRTRPSWPSPSRTPTSCWPPSGWPTCSGCRPSTPTTASGSTGTGPLARELTIASVVESLLPVLDDIHLARQHGDLESGPFASIADKLEATLAKYGVRALRRARARLRPGGARRADACRGGTGRRYRGDHRGRRAAARLPDRRPGDPSGPGVGGRPELTIDVHPADAATATISS